MPGRVFSTKRDMAMSAPVLPAETAACGLTGLHRINRLPHAAFAAATAQGLAWLLGHAHGHIGVADFGLGLQFGMLLQQGRNDGLIPEQQEPIGWVADGREFGAGNHNARRPNRRPLHPVLLSVRLSLSRNITCLAELFSKCNGNSHES